MGKRKKKDKAKGPPIADGADRHTYYERAVQCVESEIDFVDDQFQRLTGRRAEKLREDFCGTANTACEWVRRRPTNRAVGIDLSSEVLAWGRAHRATNLGAGACERIELIEGDVTTTATPDQDIIIAMNFSYWIFKSRETLRSYFAFARSQLAKDGVFFLDCYGGYDAFRVMKEKTDHGDFTYIWDQASYNPVDGTMLCHIHFKFADGSRLDQAFTYEWRLWTLPEIQELLGEAGFGDIKVYWQGWDDDEEDGNGVFEPVTCADPDAGWICYLSGQS
ncbi:MAG: class I SAM-dependent methyltransferase [Pseudomonadota bacterium]